MCSAGVEVTAQESMAAAPLDHLVAGPGETAAADDRHPLALLGVAPDGPLELSRLVFHESTHDRQVGAAERAVLQLGRKGSVACIVAGDDDQARRALVEPVDYAGARHTPDHGPATAPAQERMHERAGGMAWRRGHDHARRLIDDGEVVVFVDDF